MALNDLLEGLKLNDCYKLSFSEAIKITGENKSNCQKQFGRQIVRKILLLDSTAVISIATELNESLKHAKVKREVDKVLNNSLGGRSSQKSNVRPSFRKDKSEPIERRFHPMDLLVVIMNCCDDLLRQILVERMFANKLSIPILLPDVRNDAYTLLLLALRSLVPGVQVRTRKNSGSLSDTLVDVKSPVLSFIRIGNLRRSKSKLVNAVLSFNSFNTFYHRECPNGSAKRSVSNGSIEAAWFQSEKPTEEEFNCRFLMALNLRGNAKDHPKQTQFLCESSTLIVFMVASFKQFKELYESVLKNAKLSQKKLIVCYIPTIAPGRVGNKYLEFLEAPDNYAVIYDSHGTEKINDDEFANELRNKISELLRQKPKLSDEMSTYTSIAQKGKKFEFSVDEVRLKHETEKSSADKFVDLLLKQEPDCKPNILPLQGEAWIKIGKLEREQRAKLPEENENEYSIAEKAAGIKVQRQIQCRSLTHLNEVTRQFSLEFHILQEQTLLHYLNSCKIKLDARSRVIKSNLLEQYNREKLENQSQLSSEEETIKLGKKELQIETSTIRLEHILREHGQMYEAMISEESRMKEELKKAPLTPDVIRNFPKKVAKLLLSGQPLELMDGDASHVPITWLKAVLKQVRLMNNNAKIFVLSIIGVQSSGKSTLLNALFGLQFPVGAGRCTRGIYCHLVPIDKGSLQVEYDYVLVADTEGLGSSQFTEGSTFRDNELATFAIGLADATLINMKGENWAEMTNILQIVAYGLIRIRKTKAELELMPRCMFLHQNVSAADAERNNQLGQAGQLLLLDKEIKAAAHKEGFRDINKFHDLIKIDPDSHSWYFPDLWNGSPPKARISHDYVNKTNELRQYLMKILKNSSSQLTIENFFLRMSDLWNAMLHNDFVLCFKNTQDIKAATVLNDKISHEVDSFRNLNKLQQTKIRDSIGSYTSIEEFKAEMERIMTQVSESIETNFTNMKAALQGDINAIGICSALKEKYEVYLNEMKEGERLRLNHEMAKDISVHEKKLEYENDKRVKNLKARLTELEKRSEEVDKEKLDETYMKEFEELWQQLINDNKSLVDERKQMIRNGIEKKIRESIAKLNIKTADWEDIFKTPLDDKMPQVTENDIVHNEETTTEWLMDLVDEANSRLAEAYKTWKVQFESKTCLEFNASVMEQVMIQVDQLLGITSKDETRKDHDVVGEAGEIIPILPTEYSFNEEFLVKYIKFVCHCAYNHSLQNSEIFISLADPLADIEDRYNNLVSYYQQMSAGANIDAVSQQIFDFAKDSFVTDLGELLKAEVCREENPTFKSKRAFLKKILTYLGEKIQNSTLTNAAKQKVFTDFMSYVNLGDSTASQDFFFNFISKLLKEMLTKETESKTAFQKMVEDNMGGVVERAKHALRQAETNCKGCAQEYVRLFEDYVYVIARGKIDFRINILDNFTEAVVEKLNNLYADFLGKANSSFEELVGKHKSAAIRPLFKKIMGCQEICLFCSAPCSQSLQDHPEYHRAIHYPTGVTGTAILVQETQELTKAERKKLRPLALDTCQTMIGKLNEPKFCRWNPYLHNYNLSIPANLKEGKIYKNWEIPYSADPKSSLYWKWFMAQFVEELAEHHTAKCPELPQAWRDITWEDAKESLDELDLNSEYSAEE